MKSPTLIVLLILSGIALGCPLAKGQQSPTSGMFRVEVFKPEYQNADYSFTTGAVILTARETMEGDVAVDLQVPLAYVRRDGVADAGWEFRVGNPYLGLLWTSRENPATLGFGLSVPILPDDADVRIMRVADMHRYELFAPNIWSFSFQSTVGGDLDPLQGKSITSFWIPIEGDFEIVTNYSLTVRRPIVNLLASLQVRGRAGLTGDALVFGERARHEVGAIFEFLTTGFRPGFFVRKPIQGREIVDWVFGWSVAFY